MPLTSVTVTLSDYTAGATGVTATIGFTPATGLTLSDFVKLALPAEWDTSSINLEYDPTGVPGVAGTGIVSGFKTGAFVYQTTEPTPGAIQLDLYNYDSPPEPQVLAAGQAAVLTLSGLINPAAGTYTLDVSTSQDTTPVGDDVVITGGTGVPTVVTVAASGIGTTTAQMNGTVTANGTATSVLFRYGTAADLTGAATVAADQSPLGSGATNAVVSKALTGLTPGVVYYYRVEATNDDGTSVGSILSFAPIGDRFWVGGSGNFSDTAHWSATSGGSGGASVPRDTLNARFDANSFASSGQTVTLDADSTCRNFDWTGVTNAPTFAWGDSYALTVRGNITLVAGMSFSGAIRSYPNLSLILQSSGSQTITFAGKTLPIAYLRGGGTWTQQDAAHIELFPQAGRWVSAGHDFTGTINDGAFTAATSADFSGSTIWCTDWFQIRDLDVDADTVLDLNPAVDFTHVDMDAYVPTIHAHPRNGDPDDPAWHVLGDISCDLLILEGAGYYPVINGEGTLTVGELQVANASGVALVKLAGPMIASASLSADYLNLVGAVLTGVTPGLAGPNSVNGGGNTGWSFASPPDATTTTATSLTTTTATLRGTVAPNGASTTVSVRYSRNADLSGGTVVACTQSPVAGNAGTTTVTAAITGLLSDLTYYYRVEASNTAGSDNGAIVSFETAHGDPRGSITIGRAEVGTVEVTRG